MKSAILRRRFLRNFEKHRRAGTLHQSWIHRTRCINGAKKEDKLRPPQEAIDAIKPIIVEYVGFKGNVSHDHSTEVDAPLLEAWWIAAKDPDNEVGPWMMTGALGWPFA